MGRVANGFITYFKRLGMAIWMVLILVLYFFTLLGISWFTARKSDNQSFFRANQSAPWYIVAFGMIGTSLSGVTFVSVPGTVGVGGWHYYQMVIGFFVGYFIVAYVLLPLYYKLNLTSIYRYLEYRLGFSAYQWGAGYFILSRTIGATVRLYLVINVLQLFVFDSIDIPFWLTSLIIMAMIVAYTLKGGVKTIVWTDTLQTIFMLLALVVCIIAIQQAMGMDWSSLWKGMEEQGMLKIWGMDPLRKDYFLKHIIGGAFITITMTGLDQEMMQKNISVKSLKDAQKNMITFSFVLLLVNALFLFLGGTLFLFAAQNGWQYAPDDLFPSIVQQHLSPVIFIIFIIGLISALFPSVDGAITALTASFCIDILGFHRNIDAAESDLEREERQTRTRKKVHLSFALLFIGLVFLFKWINDKNIVDLIFKIAGYTYGPLLGLFAFGIVTKYQIKSKWLFLILIISPTLCWILDKWGSPMLGGYQFGYELLILNGAFTFLGLWLIRGKGAEYKSEV
jgi:Na+/proline symporter